MPYITKKRRHALARGYPDKVENAGELNYKFTRYIVFYLKEHGLSYQTINDILGALEGAKQEFYRRVAVPHERKKMKSNGDVYD